LKNAGKHVNKATTTAIVVTHLGAKGAWIMAGGVGTGWRRARSRSTPGVVDAVNKARSSLGKGD